MSSLLDLDNLDLNSPQARSLPTQEELLSSLLSTSRAALPSKQAMRTISSHQTQVFAQAFADRILIIVTQMNRIGSLIQITPSPLLPAPLPPVTSSQAPKSLFPSLPPIPPSTQLTNLFGVAPSRHMGDLYELYANQVGAIVSAAGEERPVLLGIGLKTNGGTVVEEEEKGVTEEERMCFGEVMEMVKECQIW